jgi:hypothetical protein
MESHAAQSGRFADPEEAVREAVRLVGGAVATLADKVEVTPRLTER